jgi:asparagine synthase (glutamine-hydrolysing)
MSGIVGMVQRERQPVARSLLWGLTDALAYRGPDAQDVWSAGEVGLGHTLLATTFEAVHERQPCSLDGVIWITADLRLDARPDLLHELRSAGRELRSDVTDPVLVLHAYQVWGERCVDHLRGDFAFAIWDGRERQLFCVRDQIGVKQFFYSVTKTGLVFSNTLDCVRGHPDVSRELNDLAIADFLIFRFNQELDTTSFSQIRRLPPAHCLRWQDGKVTVRRYWTLACDKELRYRRREQYVEHFLEVLGQAVEDRLRTNRTLLCFSGGLDSTSVAALARERSVSRGRSVQFQAVTSVYDSLIPDREREYAAVAAQHLRIPVAYLGADHYELFERWDQPGVRRPEPNSEPCCNAMNYDFFRFCAERGRVALGGHGGDPVQLQSLPYPWIQFKRGHWIRLAVDMWHSLALGRWPRLGLRTWWRRRRDKHRHPGDILPPWLNSDLVRELRLEERIQQMSDPVPCLHEHRPEVYRSVTSVGMIEEFNDFDPGITRCCLEVRQPYFDLRVIDFFLAIPGIPWSHDKALVRLAMRRHLPEVICSRRKAPLAGEPIMERLQREDTRWIDEFVASAEFGRFVNRKALPPLWRETDRQRLYRNLRPVCLNHWLCSRNKVLDSIPGKVGSHGNRVVHASAETL